MRRLIANTNCLTVGALVITLLTAPNLFGQDTNLRATAFAGGSFLKAEHTFLVGGEGFRTKFASGGKFGFRVTGDVDKHMALEGTYSYGTNNLRVLELGPPIVERDFGVRAHQLTGNLLYFFNGPSEKLRPFVTAGVGFARFNPTDDAKAFAVSREFIDGPAAISGSNKGIFNVGVGVEGKFNDVWGFRLDARDHMTGTPRFGLAKPSFPASGIAHGLELSAGLVYYLKR
jgi:hypothetical protein